NQIKNSRRNIGLVYVLDKKETKEGGGDVGARQEQLYSPLQIEDNNKILIEADKGRIIQVVDNLLSNALKFTNEGTISISVERKDGQVVVVNVKDNGQGIHSSILPKLFTKFASKSQTGGTGLGLFISKNIIEAHGGKIWAENNADSRGATFSFSLPLTDNNPNPKSMK
ncbi:MAG TPA: HAMP domain-containing sensor histidine kinase, partial [Nitrososphaeraceae archaeon]|nr:HAMP domain-containing sensor histidine kinase [Nitrososphaeraceae archaeon]